MILGLTGAIGSGKSAVLAEFSKRNWLTVDADKLCHAVYEKAPVGFVAKLRELFGDACVDNANRIDRKVIAGVVFSDKSMLEKLETLIIPEFENEFFKFISDCRKQSVDAVCEVPLLFENGYQRYFDAVVGIWTPDSLRRERLQQMRNMSAEEIVRREHNQFSSERKIELSDYCIVNDGTVEDIGRQLELLLKEIRRK